MAEFVEITCCRCGIRFGMTAQTHAELKKSSHTFSCPYGHQQHFPLGPTKEDQLRQERDLLQQRLAQKDDEIAWQRRHRESAARSASAYKGQATKLRRRAKAGVCPCCNRHFEQLERHMSVKHPDFQPEAEEEALT